MKRPASRILAAMGYSQESAVRIEFRTIWVCARPTSLPAADERETSPITALVARLAAAIHIKHADKIAAILDKRRAENREYLFAVLLDEFKKSNKRIEELSEQHRQFLETEYLDLLADGLRKAENGRAKERINRIAQILASAAEIGPVVSPDNTEELMRIAVDLSDMDVAVLREIHREQSRFLEGNQVDRVNRESANDAWRESPPRIEGVSEREDHRLRIGDPPRT